MPVSKCENGLYRIGSGECRYETKEKAEEVWRAILASGNYGKPNINGKDIDKSKDNLRKEEGRQGTKEQE
jgi:hypothetical protein